MDVQMMSLVRRTAPKTGNARGVFSIPRRPESRAAQGVLPNPQHKGGRAPGYCTGLCPAPPRGAAQVSIGLPGRLLYTPQCQCNDRRQFTFRTQDKTICALHLICTAEPCS